MTRPSTIPAGDAITIATTNPISISAPPPSPHSDSEEPGVFKSMQTEARGFEEGGGSGKATVKALPMFRIRDEGELTIGWDD